MSRATSAGQEDGEIAAYAADVGQVRDYACDLSRYRRYLSEADRAEYQSSWDAAHSATLAWLRGGDSRLVTLKTLTDADILKFGQSCREGTANDAIGRRRCIVALGLDGPKATAEQITACRIHIAMAINARNGVQS